MTALDDLLVVLTLEQLSELDYRGASQDLGWGAVYGGQLLAQSLRAAQRTIKDNQQVHSMHAYFLEKAVARESVLYRVRILRDGRSFSQRRVDAYQKERLIFTAQLSFQVLEKGLFHQQVPPLPGQSIDSLYSERAWAEKVQEALPLELRSRAVQERAFEVRLLNPIHPRHPDKQPPKRGFWCRVHTPRAIDRRLARCLIAWMSDGHLLTTSLLPHGVTWLTPAMQVGSLDHALWFHRDIELTDWWFYEMRSPIAIAARGLVYGQMIQGGDLCVSAAQEGLIRQRLGSIS